MDHRKRKKNEKKKVTLDLRSVLSDMMHVLGDVKQPLKESVDLMDNILRNEMNILLVEAENKMRLRQKTEISHEDILFLLRRNKVKLKRLLEYLKLLDDLPRIKCTSRSIIDDDFPEDEISKKGGKRIKKCMEFLSIIEDLEEFTSVLHDDSIVDHQARKRQERLDFMTQLMTAEEYMEYAEKRCTVCFCPEKTTDFKLWLLQSGATKCDLTPLALTMVYFLARETVSALVDQAILIKSKRHEQTKTFLSKDSTLMDSCIKTTSCALSSENIVDRSKVDDTADDLVFKDSNIQGNSEQDASTQIYEESAITYEEIMDAFAYYQEPAPIVKFFMGSPYAAKRQTRLICLADHDT